MSVEKPLLSISEVNDPVIERLKSVSSSPEIVSQDGINLGEIDFEDKRYGVVTKPITTYGDTPIIIGAYFDGSGIASLMISILRTILIGAIILLIGLGVVLWLSRVITRPIRQTAEVASAIAALDFDGIDPLPRNRIREIDDLATAFNGMLVGLKSFGRYVPRNLVRQLIREHREGAGIEERDLTVMFTDIAGFTSACEGMTPPDVAEFINHHLTLVSNCIEQEGGTIDKYIGDAVMAFWGAPDSIDHQTQRAVRAAAALQIALAADNQERARKNLPPVRIRIGIHTGPLIVGDIGSPNRINYTVIGDVVNTTQRLEALGKEVDADAESIVLVSRSVKDSVGQEMKFDEIGPMKVKGRQGEIEVYRLAEGPDVPQNA
jgi:adenylate cyclase